MADVIHRMRDVFIEAVIDGMETDDSVFFLAADFGSPKLDLLISKFPDRFLNVGIAEQNLINVAAGLALEGHTVVAYAIAPFLSMRCYEQIRINLALLSTLRPMNVTLLGVGAGFSYDVSGPTHQALEDISIMRALPNVEVISPCDWISAKALSKHCLATQSIKYVRLDGKPLPAVYRDATQLDMQRGFSELRQGTGACLISTGYMTHKAMKVADRMADACGGIGVVDMFMLKRFDEDCLADVLRRYRHIFTIEEGFAGKGGVDSLILHLMNRHEISGSFHGFGLDDEYRFEVGNRDTLLAAAGLGEDHITAIVQKRLAAETESPNL